MIDKSTKQHYEMQGKVKNYLGKQKMVKAPKYWKSGPDHPDTELAYITKAEKDLILKADLHGSLSKGPNRGPSGIISLNSAGSGYGGPGPGSSGGGGNGGGNPNQDRAREEAARANRQAAQDRAAASMREQAAQRSREEAAQKVTERKALSQATISTNPIGGVDQFAKEVVALEDQYPSGTKLGLGDLPGTLQDYYRNKVGVDPQNQFQVTGPKAAGPMNYLQRGYQPPLGTDETESVINPFEQPGARTAIPTTPLRTRIQDDRAEDIRRKALGDVALQTDKSLIDISDPSKKGIMGSLIDSGKSKFKQAAPYMALNTLGLGALNIPLGIAKALGYDPINTLMSKMPTGTGTNIDFGPSKGGDGDKGQVPTNIIQASIEKFQPTDQQTAQMDEIMRKRMILQGYADKGQLNEQGMNTLTQMNQMISQYQVDPGSLYG